MLEVIAGGVVVLVRQRVKAASTEAPHVWDGSRMNNPSSHSFAVFRCHSIMQGRGKQQPFLCLLQDFSCPPVAVSPGESGSSESAVLMATIVVALTTPATRASAFPMVSALLQADTSCIRKVVPIAGGWKLHVSWPNVVQGVMSLD